MFILYRKMHPKTDGMGWAIGERADDGTVQHTAFTTKAFGVAHSSDSTEVAPVGTGRAWELSETAFTQAPRVEVLPAPTPAQIYSRMGEAASAAYETEQRRWNFDNR